VTGTSWSPRAYSSTTSPEGVKASWEKVQREAAAEVSAAVKG
jgi:hypothetical protein